MSIAIRRCPYCKTGQRVRIETDGRGGLVESPLPCGCAERRAEGLCIDCGEPTEGKSWRCDPCKAVAASRDQKRYRRSDKGAATQRRDNARRRKARRTKKHGDRVRARDRAYRRANRDRINANRVRRILADAGARKAEHRRSYRERHPERVLEQMRRQNARPERQQAKRDWAHLYQTKYAGTGEKPVCRRDGCANEVPWDGLGRPRLDCFVCRPIDSRERKSPRVVALAEQQEVATEERVA